MSDRPAVKPDDEHNRVLAALTHPPDWIDPDPAPMYNLVVIGAGPAGLISSKGAASLGAKVALVERAFTGGDCLITGCVPSKAMIRSSLAAHELRTAGEFGLARGGTFPERDFPRVMERMRRLRSEIGRYDSVSRITSAGIDVFLGEARFSGPRALTVNGRTLHFKKAVIATGSRPAEPPVQGLKEAGFLTNDTIFSLTELPPRLAVIGGGPIGCEMAQAFARLGSDVTIIQRNVQFLPRDDRNVSEILARSFEKDGIAWRLETTVDRVEKTAGGNRLHLTGPAGNEVLEADHILVAVGRRPNIESLNLTAAGIGFDARSGVLVNRYLQTSNRRIYAAGDVCFPYKFTHMAEATARIVVQNSLFLRSKSHRSLLIPWCTYTDPEIAHVGLTLKQAEKEGLEVDTYFTRIENIDRSHLDGDDEGFVKILTLPGKDKILGATIMARHAGEMIGLIIVAMMAGKGLKTLANVIHPSPTRSEAVKWAAGKYYQRKLSPRLQVVLKRWFSWKR